MIQILHYTCEYWRLCVCHPLYQWIPNWVTNLKGHNFFQKGSLGLSRVNISNWSIVCSLVSLSISQKQISEKGWEVGSRDQKSFGIHVKAEILWEMLMFRPVGSGAAWRRSPHQKSAGKEKRKKRKERKKEEGRGWEERRGEGKEGGEMERKGEESKRERCIVCVNTPLELSKNYKDTDKGEEKKHGKDPEEKMEEETEKVRENIVTEDILRCENTICISFKY